MGAGIRLLQDQLVANRNLKIGIGALVVLAGGLLLGNFLAVEPLRTQLTLQIFGAIIAMTGGSLILSACLNFDVRKHPLVRVIQQSPETVVWVYPYIAVNMPYGIKVIQFATLYFKLEDRSDFSIQIRARDKDRIMNALKPMLPQTTFGYSTEKEQLYKANPYLLRKSRQ